MSNQLDIEREINQLLTQREATANRLRQSSERQVNLSREAETASREHLDSLTRLGDKQSEINAQMEESVGLGGMLSGVLGGMQSVWMTLTKAITSAKNAIQGFWGLAKTAFHYLSGSWFLGPLIDSAMDYQSQMGGANDTTNKFIETFGSLRGETSRMAVRYMQNMRKEAKGLAGSFKTLGSQIGASMSALKEHAIETLGKLGVEIGILGPKLEKVGPQFMVMQRGLGLSVESFAHIARGASDVRGKIVEMTKAAVAMSKRYGLSMKAIGTNLEEALKDHQHFGHMAPKELMKVVGYATKLGLQISELTAFADGFDTFESAAEKVGKLSSAFGIQLDTMEMVMEDDPAKKLDMVRRALDRAGVSIKDISKNRREMQYLADSIGLPVDKLKQMSEVSTSEFGFTNMAQEIGDDMKEMTEQEAMQSMAESMRDVAGSMKQMAQANSFWGSFVNGLTEGIEKSAAWKVAMKSVLGPMKAFNKAGKGVGGMIMELFYEPGKGKMKGKNVATGPLAELFNIFFGKGGYFDKMKEFANTIEGPFKIVRDFFQQLTDKGPDFGKGVNIFDLFFDNIGELPDNPNQILYKHRKKIYKIVMAIARVISDAFKFIGKGAVKWVEGITNPKQVTEKMEEEGPTLTETLAEGFGEIFEGMIQMFSDIWLAGGKLWDHLWKGSDRPGIQETFWEATDKGVRNMMNDPKNKSTSDKIFKMLMGWFLPEGMEKKYDEMSLNIGEKFTIFALSALNGMIKGIQRIAAEKGKYARAVTNRMKASAEGTHSIDGSMLAANPIYQFWNSIALADEESGALEDISAWMDKEIANIENIGKLRNEKLRDGFTKNQSEFYAMLADLDKTSINEKGDEVHTNLGMGKGNTGGMFLSADNLNAALEMINAEGKNKWPKLYKLSQKIHDELQEEYRVGISAGTEEEWKANRSARIKSLQGDMTAEFMVWSNEARHHRQQKQLEALRAREAAKKEATLTQETVAIAMKEGHKKSMNKIINDPLVGESTLSFSNAAIKKPMEKDLQLVNPSMWMVEKGEQTMKGFMIGLFGSYPGESVTRPGFSQAFHDQWDLATEQIKNIISGTQEELAHLPILDIETKLKKVGSVLKGEKPMTVVVQNDKIEIYLSVKVHLDTKQIAKSLAKPSDFSDEPYFVINPDRTAGLSHKNRSNDHDIYGKGSGTV